MAHVALQGLRLLAPPHLLPTQQTGAREVGKGHGSERMQKTVCAGLDVRGKARPGTRNQISHFVMKSSNLKTQASDHVFTTMSHAGKGTHTHD
eukprot:1139846-Pelagomonas_calceolata.AAC.5